MRPLQLVVLLQVFFFSSQPKYSCSIESWTKGKEEKEFCVNYDGLASLSFFFSIVLSLFAERIDFKKSVMGLLGIYSLLSLFSMTTEHYLTLHIFQQSLAITSMVLRNLVLVVVLNRSSLQQKSIAIVLYRILDIIGVQLPTAVFGLAEHYAFQSNPALFLYDFATGLLALMMVFNSFHRGSYRSIATSEKQQEQSLFPTPDPSLFGLLTDLISVPKCSVLIFVLISITCSSLTNILSTMDIYAGLYHRFSEKLYSIEMGGLWVATEVLASVAFVVIIWRFGKSMKAVIIVSMAALTLSACALGFFPITQESFRTDSMNALGLHKCLFHVAQFFAVLTTLSCILSIATTLRSGLRCSILTIFTASPLVLTPILREVGSLFSFYVHMPSFILLNTRQDIMKLVSRLTDSRPFMVFAFWTIAVFIATLFIRVDQRSEEENEDNTSERTQQDNNV